MPTSLKKTELTQVAPTHVDLFVEYYDELKKWAQRLSEYDHEQSEDLLHDFFLHFTVSKPDLNHIQNLEGYLYVNMRNLHLSQVRRQTRMPMRSMTVVEYDTVDVSLWASDPRDRIRMRDELGAICQYACIRKESSKAGSVLILRFFHGYYPDEIARIMRITRPAVKERLRLARAEAKLYLEDPDRLLFLGDESAKPTKFTVGIASGDLRLQLRQAIFKSRHGEHLTEQTINKLYKTESPDGPECRELAHVVSCAACLDQVNTMLEIPTLASRYAEDTIGKDPGKKDGSGGGSSAGGGRKMLDSYIRRSNELFYHEPQELCISVNGHLQGLQRVASEKSEMTLIIDMAETVGFVEVFSEQGIRLLMLNVETPPTGDAKQSAQVELSDGRTLNADLNFSGAFPALQVTYNNPSLAVNPNEVIDAAVSKAETNGQQSPFPYKGDVAEGREGSLLSKLSKPLKGFEIRPLFQPARLTAGFTMLLIAALVWFKFGPTTTVSATELLQKSVEMEDARLSNKDRVVHRTFDFEEIKDGQVASRKRIDVWHSAERGTTARRIYDDQGRLTMGDWRAANGIRTIYQRGHAAKFQPSPASRIKGIEFEDVWQLSLTAKEFTEMLGSVDQAKVETRDREYVINYASQNVTDGITKATIILGKEDLHAIEQSFTLRRGADVREFRFKEVSYEWRPANAVAPAVFEPNVELTGMSVATQAETQALASVSNANASEANTNTASEPSTTANLATPALEVEVIDLLNNAGAFMGEQISVQRTAAGQIQVNGLVETAQRKTELLNALTPVIKNSAVRINIETVTEVQAREARKKKGSAGVQTVEQVQATEGTSPVYNDLRKKFSESEARAFADRVLQRGAQARRHALAMKQLSERFSLTDLQSLSAAERGKWLGLLRGHADKFLSETETLRRELQSIFPDLGPGSAPSGLDSGKEIQATVRRLYDLAVAADEDLRGSFAVFTNAAGSAEVKTVKFWRTLNNATELARAIQSAM